MEGNQNRQHCRTAMLAVENITDDSVLLITYDPDKTSAQAIEDALANGLDRPEYEDMDFVEAVRDILSDLVEEVRVILLIQV
jgi:hypothetical protein